MEPCDEYCNVVDVDNVVCCQYCNVYGRVKQPVMHIYTVDYVLTTRDDSFIVCDVVQ